jgi:hypothetical protein
MPRYAMQCLDMCFDMAICVSTWKYVFRWDGVFLVRGGLPRTRLATPLLDLLLGLELLRDRPPGL